MLSACFEPCSDHSLSFKNKPWELTFWRKIVYPFFILIDTSEKLIKQIAYDDIDI